MLDEITRGEVAGSRLTDTRGAAAEAIGVASRDEQRPAQNFPGASPWFSRGAAQPRVDHSKRCGKEPRYSALGGVDPVLGPASGPECDRDAARFPEFALIRAQVMGRLRRQHPHREGKSAVNPQLAIDLTSRKPPTRAEVTPAEEAEERRLWADYYEATVRALEIMRAEGTSAATLLRIAAEQEKAAAAIKRIKEIRGLQS
jgi:hypothetical protein